MKVTHLASALALLTLTAGPVLAAPCSTGTTKAKTPDQQASNPSSSDADKSSKNLAGGQQPASPGTVGAMNNAGATQTADRQAQTNTDGKSNGTDPAAANLAGGQQPASPGTVGAMNKAAADRQTAPVGNDGC
ncbi:exopolysaccharide production protein YjbE [Methylobacterium sp. J-070]|uniref:exopolysaccharide production protein YjbE n=1 Tax=Methylobacterium sp. J-070 TaxID=2836650 RepID=UPI001FBBC1A7|nr:exopolysaccharide production protein YjbE [Methylobacterium sp. J-070]MCJ2048816.1 exopolysaccharide production protein YjbE [Methylobacterium sp. J-070]